MIRYLKEILEGFGSLIGGMGITIRHFFKKPVTVIYPKERIAIKRFKGPISFVVDEKTKDHRCISCNACIKICPSRCMQLEAKKSVEGNKRILTDFKVNYMLCSLCSLCVDVCPTDALMHAEGRYDMVSLAQKDLDMDLLQPFREQGTPLTKIPVIEPGQKTAPAAPPKKPDNPQPPAVNG